MKILVPSHLESALMGLRPFSSSEGEWSNRVRERGLLINLSKIEWVELGALIQLVAMVEGAARAGITTVVAMPSPKPRQSEERWLGDAAAQASARQRAKVRSFLTTIGFERALDLRHLGAIPNRPLIVDDWDDSSAPADEVLLDQVEKVRASRDEEPPLHKYCFPLTWIDTHDHENVTRMWRFLRRVITSRNEGLENIDVAALINVLLFELVDNASTHSRREGPAPALVAAWARPAHTPPVAEHYLATEMGYVNWIRDSRTPLIEIAVADSGEGFLPRLRESFRATHPKGYLVEGFDREDQILLWAFDRWSSRLPQNERRGTRGLYRVHRVVRKYEGLIALRTANRFLVLDHGGAGYDEAEGSPPSLASIPGSILRIRLPPSKRKEVRKIELLLKKPPAQYEFVYGGQLTQDGLTKEARVRLLDKLRPSQIVGVQRIVVLVLSGGVASRDALEAVLREAVDLRHPSALIILGLPGGWELIDSAVDSINQEHHLMRKANEALKPDHFSIWDPVLVVGEREECAWVGASKSFLATLNTLMKEPTGTMPLAERVAEHTVVGGIPFLPEIRTDRALITESPDGKTISLSISLSAIFEAIASRLQEAVQDQANREVGPWLTPSLTTVDSWLDVHRALSSSVGVEIAMRGLAAGIRRCSAVQGFPLPSLVLADPLVSPVTLRSLAGFLGDIRSEVIHRSERGSYGGRFVPRGAAVMIYTDIISSGELIAGFLAQVLRAEGNPVCVACAVDARANPEEPLSVWDRRVDVVSLSRADLTPRRQYESRQGLRRRSPLAGKEEVGGGEVGNGLHYRISRDEMQDIVSKRKALTLSHLGRSSDRHYTFFLYTRRLLGDERIKDGLNAALDEWKKNSGIEEESIEIWFAKRSSDEPASTSELALWIKESRRDVVGYHAISILHPDEGWAGADDYAIDDRSRGIAVLEWGAFSGATIMAVTHAAAVSSGGRPIFVGIVASHLPPERERFFRELSTVQAESRRGNKAQRDLFGDSDRIRQIIQSGVTIEFLTSFGIRVYNEHECPVCAQLHRLARERHPTTLLEEFGRWQEEKRLRLRYLGEVIGSPPLDLDGRELSAEGLRWMLDLRRRLVAALTSTAVRLETKLELEEFAASQPEDNPSIKRRMWFLQFLSVESQWLEMPPMRFKALRQLIARIAIGAANDTGLSEVDRIGAIIVLRTTSKEAFARALPSLFEHSRPHQALTRQILYAAYTFTSRPYLRTRRAFQVLRKGLEQGVKFYKNSAAADEREVLWTIEALLRLIDFKTAGTSAQAMSATEAWQRLRRNMLENWNKHSAVPGFFSRLLPRLFESDVEDAIRTGKQDGLPFIWVRNLEHNWMLPLKFLERTFIPTLSRVAKVLGDPDLRAILGPEGTEALRRLVARDEPLGLSFLARLIHDCSSNPTKLLNAENWSFYCQRIELLYRTIFEPRSVGGSRSRFIEVLEAVPTELGTTLKSVTEEAMVSFPSLSIEVNEDALQVGDVFSTSGLIRDALWTAFENCRQHAVDSATSAIPMRVELYTWRREDEIVVEIKNDHSVHREGGSQTALKSLAERLERFEGQLIPERCTGEWTFRLELVFKLMEGL